MRLFIGQIAESRPRAAVSGVDFNLLAGFSVLERDDANIRHHLFAFVLNVNRNEIVPATADRERVREIRRLKVGNQKHNRTARDDFGQIIERESSLSSAASRLAEYNRPNAAKPV